MSEIAPALIGLRRADPFQLKYAARMLDGQDILCLSVTGD